MPSFQRHVFVCVNERPADDPKGCCKAKGGVEVRDKLKAELKARGISKLVRANNAGCLDQCAQGVTVVVYPEQVCDAGVADRRRGLRLVEEPLHELAVLRQLRAQELHRRGPAEQLVLGPIHRALSATRQLAHDAIAAEHLPDHRCDDSNRGR